MARMPPTRPKKPAKTKSPASVKVMFRFPPELLASLDSWADSLNETGGGPQWSRTDVVKAALQRALRERASKGEAP